MTTEAETLAKAKKLEMELLTINGNTSEQEGDQYSSAMVDTIFADSLSRGMQNAITSQQNAQMAASSAITHVCASILQARPKSSVLPAEAPVVDKQEVCTGKVPDIMLSKITVSPVTDSVDKAANEDDKQKQQDADKSKALNNIYGYVIIAVVMLGAGVAVSHYLI